MKDIYLKKNQINRFIILTIILLTTIQVLGFEKLIPELYRLINIIGLSVAIIGVFFKKKYSKLIIIVATALITTYIINYTFAYYSVFKWLINTIGFIYIFIIMGSSVQQLNKQDMIFIDLVLERYFIILALILIGLMLFPIIAEPSFILSMLMENQYNVITAQLNSLYGIEKQGLGTGLFLIFLWAFLKFKHIGLFKKSVFGVLCSVSFVFWVGSRTFIMAIILMLLYFTRFYIVTTLVLFFAFALYFSYNWQYFLSLMIKFYDRLPSIIFSFDFLRKNLFGIGNGGYHIYVNKHQQELFGIYQKYMSIHDSFWMAPESDIAYFLGSFGILSVVFLLLYIYLLFKGRELIKKVKIHYLDKYFVLVMSYLIFSGISQDNAVGLIWWVYLGASFGVIFRYKFRFNSHKKVNNKSKKYQNNS